MTVRWAIVGAIIGAILGSVITAGSLLYISTKARQENTARELLSEVMALESLKEGWLLQGEGSQSAKLSDNPGLPETESGSRLWLLPVEIRAILDEAEWNSPPDQNYGFMQGRRVWIVRNEIVPGAPLSYIRSHSKALSRVDQHRWNAGAVRLDRARADRQKWRDADGSRTCGAEALFGAVGAGRQGEGAPRPALSGCPEVSRMMSGRSGARSSLRIDATSDRGPAIRCFANCRFQYDERKMIPLSGLRKGFACAPLLASLTMLSGCITSNDAIFNTSTTPVRSGRYDVQYLVDGQWTNYGAGSLTLVGGEYIWSEDREAASLLNWNRSSLRATLVGIAKRLFRNCCRRR